MARTQANSAQIKGVDLGGSADDITGTLTVPNGGTGNATNTLNNVLLGNGTGALQAVAPSTAGKVLRSDGTTWASTVLAATDLTGTLPVANGGTGQTSLTGLPLTGPKVNQLLDANGNVLIDFGPQASAVNYIEIDNAPTGGRPAIYAWGSDPTVGLSFNTRGGGTIELNNVPIVTTTGTQDLTGKRETLAAGSATVAPLKFTSGTNLTTAAAGAAEFDGTVFYLTPAASTRHVNDAEQFITLTSTYTLANQTAVQKLFNSSTNGTVTLVANSTYFFECCFTLTALNASSHSVGFALGGTAALTRQAWWCDACLPTTGLSTANTTQRTYNTAANTTLVTAGTNTTFSAVIKGKIVVGTGGTLIPQVSQLTNAAAAIVGNDSYFRIWSVGANTVTNVGNWS